MFSAIKNAFISSQAEAILNKANIDTSHNMIPFKNLKLFGEKMPNRALSHILVQSLSKKIQSSNLSLQLKSLIALHECFKYSSDGSIINLILEQQTIQNYCDTEIESKSPNSYLGENINNFYLVYLKKLCVQTSAYKLVNLSKTSTIQSLLKNHSVMELINHGFKILNLGTYLLTSQRTFLQTGRYYRNYQEILSLYLQLVQDLNNFNEFIKKLVSYFLSKIVEEESCKVQITINSICITEEEIIESEQRQTELEEKEENKHILLFIYEGQILCDNLFQFHNNKFYAPIMKKYIFLPQYLDISQQEFIALKKRAKRIDPQLLEALNICKKNPKSKSQVIRTECDLPYRTRVTNRTEQSTPQKSHSSAYQNIGLRFMNTSIQMEGWGQNGKRKV